MSIPSSSHLLNELPTTTTTTTATVTKFACHFQLGAYDDTHIDRLPFIRAAHKLLSAHASIFKSVLDRNALGLFMVTLEMGQPALLLLLRCMCTLAAFSLDYRAMGVFQFPFGLLISRSILLRLPPYPRATRIHFPDYGKTQQHKIRAEKLFSCIPFTRSAKKMLDGVFVPLTFFQSRFDICREGVFVEAKQTFQTVYTVTGSFLREKWEITGGKVSNTRAHLEEI